MYKVRAVFSERIKIINKGCNLQKIEHANKFLLTGFEVTGMVK